MAPHFPGKEPSIVPQPPVCAADAFVAFAELVRLFCMETASSVTMVVSVYNTNASFGLVASFSVSSIHFMKDRQNGKLGICTAGDLWYNKHNPLVRRIKWRTREAYTDDFDFQA